MSPYLNDHWIIMNRAFVQATQAMTFWTHPSLADHRRQAIRVLVGK